MYLIFTEDQMKKTMEAQKKIFDAMMEDARKKQKLIEEFAKCHPPCPHCGHQEPLPIWLQ